MTELRVKLAAFFYGILLFLERTTDRQTMVIQTPVFDKHFIKNDINELITSRKLTDSICSQ